MVINLEDVNDNAPELNVSKIPIIPENVAAPLPVAIVTAFDRDTPENGPPFTLGVPSNSTFTDKFNFVFNQGMLFWFLLEIYKISLCGFFFQLATQAAVL